MPQHIYILSGLGADRRLFAKLQFDGFEVHHLEWLTPEHNEHLAHYAQRLCMHIQAPNPILIGLSFGGIVAMEMAKQIPVKKLILLASVKTKHDIPWYYRTAGRLHLHKAMPTTLLKKTNPLTYWFFGTHNEEERLLLKQILQDTPPQFLRWAIHQIVTWQNQHIPANLIHIHGAADRLLPLPKQTPTFVLKNAGHFFTLNRAPELNRLLLEVLTH